MMNFFTSDIRRNLIKILCLTVGLSVGFVIIAKVYFEKTTDTFYPDNDRLYYIAETFINSGKYDEWRQTSGAVGGNVKRYVPEVECAARRLICSGGGDIIRTQDGRELRADGGLSMVDSCFFDIFGTTIIAGNLRNTLSEPYSCVIPHSLAKKIGDNVIGTTFTLPEYERWFGDMLLKVGGVYEDFPANSLISNEIFLSMNTDPKLFSADGNNWQGNDRFEAFVKLNKGARIDDVETHLTKMLIDNVGEENLKRNHYYLKIRPISQFKGNTGILDSSTGILAILAIIMLMSASLNYLLVVLGQMPRRAKEMAVRKCYGTSNLNIFMRALCEGLFFLVLSVLLAVLVVMCLPDFCGQLLGLTPEEIFTAPGLWMVMACVFILLLTVSAIIPGILYCRTPVARAFKVNVKGRRQWKLVLLAIEFFASGMLMCLLTLISRQYSMLTSMDFGVDYENMAYIRTNSIDGEARQKVINTLKEMPGVEGVATSDCSILEYGSGNNVFIESQSENCLNISDRYSNNREIFDIAGLEFLQGGNFRETADSTVNEVIVDQRFAEEMERMFGWDSKNVVGQSFRITEHGPYDFTIVGVVNNVRRGNPEKNQTDTRGAVYFPGNDAYKYINVKFSNLDYETFRKAQEIINSSLTDKEVYLERYDMVVQLKMRGVKRFQLGIATVGIATLIITLIGLMGYTSDEVIRRSREIAIRRITGTSVFGIVKLFCLNIFVVAIPSLLAGGAAAMIFGQDILSLYTERVDLSPFTMCLCLFLILLIISAVVTLNTISVARDNLSNHLRSE